MEDSKKKYTRQRKLLPLTMQQISLPIWKELYHANSRAQSGIEPGKRWMFVATGLPPQTPLLMRLPHSLHIELL